MSQALHDALLAVLFEATGVTGHPRLKAAVDRVDAIIAADHAAMLERVKAVTA